VSGGAPSLLHEVRVEELDAMFALAGLTHTAYLQWWLRPDVARASPKHHVLAIGDAKASEAPGDQATLLRLANYARVAADWQAEGWTILMCLAIDPSDTSGWMFELRRAASIGGLSAVETSSALLHPTLTVVSLSTSRVPRSTNTGYPHTVGV
jgi:hypothetical protein